MRDLKETERDRLRSVVHDLKEPLHTAGGFLELVAARATGRLDEETARCLADARATLERMQETVREILDASAHGATDRILLRPVVEAAIHDLRRLVDERGGRVEDHVAPDAYALLPPVAFRRVVQNLIANALRHGGAEPRVVVSCAGSGDRWTLSVDDDGPGVPDDLREAVFTPGVRAPGPGHGLGLAACRRLVTSWGGRIWCERSPLGGSRFTFTCHGETAASGAEGL